jgi:hypothetical protein
MARIADFFNIEWLLGEFPPAQLTLETVYAALLRADDAAGRADLDTVRSLLDQRLTYAREAGAVQGLGKGRAETHSIDDIRRTEGVNRGLRPHTTIRRASIGAFAKDV